ncbi:hypothetical protein [Capnocytophaga sputigena]|uniref:hypothetical protein n=1 Tax=Capnocytophaga sputigena TaxID=1019 RepID=UPI0028D45F89|nr:hypothetical protein [Capnocytophaga sputigena]
MKNVKQSIKGSNNLQIVTNNAPIIHTGKLTTKINVIHNPENHITDAQAQQIKEKVIECATILASDGSNKKSLIQKQYGKLYKRYGITKYSLLPKEKFEDAIKWLKREVAASRKVLKDNAPTEWRKAQYASINARGRQIGMDREALLIYATQVLELANTLSSLKDLEDDQLQKLYNKIFGKRQ